VFYFFLTILFFCHSLWASSAEEFYIFPMGQGNSQLVIYQRPQGRVGILYDLGSKSLQMHPKFSLRKEWGELFLAPLKTTSARITEDEDEDEMPFPSTPINARKTTALQQTPRTTGKKLYTTQRETTKSELEELIYKQLESLDYLFIFLSHSDEDHINFLNNKSIPETLPITVILAGDWFGDIGAEEGKTNFTEPVKEVLMFLSLRKQNTYTYIHFPYYSRALNELISTTLQLEELQTSFAEIDSLSGGDRTQALKTLDKNPHIKPIINQCLKINPGTPTPLFLHGPFLRVFNDLPLFEEFLGRFPDILNNVYIWSLNQPADDKNSHSTVISCTLPNLGMSVVLTGDAEHSVFQRIVNENDHLFREQLASNLGINPILHTVLLMLPHHGALANRSGSMLRFFIPNAFGISAGDGELYGHPSAALINNIRVIYSDSVYHQFLEYFYTRYAYQGKFHFITLSNGRHIIDKAEVGKPLFLCPNIYGCIKWDEEGIRTNFSNIIMIGNKQYSISYATHALEANIQASTKALKPRDKVNAFSEDLFTTSLTLLPRPEDFSYDYLAECAGELYVGIKTTDTAKKAPNKIYFYKCLRMNNSPQF